MTIREVEASAEVVRLTVHVCGDVNDSLAEDEDDGEDYILYLTIVSGLRLMLHDSRGLSSGCSR